jgi:putative ABC transport system permease protein
MTFEGWAMLALACGGTFALMRLWVTSLLSELGLRRALGATRRQVVGFVLLRAAGVGLGGVLVGLWLGPAVWGIMTGVMADLPTWDAAAVARYAALLIAAAVLGAVVPAWRAARSTPAALVAWT